MRGGGGLRGGERKTNPKKQTKSQSKTEKPQNPLSRESLRSVGVEAAGSLRHPQRLAQDQHRAADERVLSG